MIRFTLGFITGAVAAVITAELVIGAIVMRRM